VEREGEPITEYPLKHSLNTGISYHPEMPGIVAEIEEREAARFSGYTWSEWKKLPRLDRVDNLAYFRLRRTMDHHQQEAAEQETERRAKRRHGRK